MGNIIATNTVRMKDDINSYNDQVDKVDKAFAEAWEAINALNASWGGPAHDLLTAQFTEDKEIMEELLSMLRANVRELDDAKKTYEKCESNVNSVIKSMRV